MGDVLPPKRQAVVDRLRRRIELYRRHQEAGYPRYEAASNALHDQQRRDTLLLQQRYLEAKAKKAKKSDHKNATKESAASAAVNNGNNNDTQRSLLVQKLNKRSAPGGSPLIESNTDNLNDDQDRQQAKIPRTSATPDSNLPGNSTNANNNANTGGSNNRSDQSFQSPNQQSQQLPSFSVQIVQQFTSSASPQSQHSQTIQTNVTVKALSGNIKSSNSPLANHSGAGQSSEDIPGASISVGTNFECKRERETELSGCNNPLSSACSGGNNNPAGPNQNSNNPLASQGPPTSSSSGQEGRGPGPNTESANDRFAETLANLGFPDDSSDDVIHADILSDLFDDDIFTNSTDLMKEFNFDESSMKDSEELGNAVMEMDKALAAAAVAAQQQQQQQQLHFQFANNPSQTSPQGVPSVFDNQTGGSGAFSPRMQGYASMNSGVMDFKLREPSPAAQTLKQMAEQHQSMQQKQMGLGLSSPHHHHHHHPQSPFGSDSFTDPLTLSSLRTNFLNGSGASLSPLSKGPPSSAGLSFPNMPFVQQGQTSNQQQQSQQQSQPLPTQAGAFTAGLRPGAGVVFKQETNTGVYPGLANPGGGSCPNAGQNSLVGQRMSPLQSDMDLHKRQSMQIQRMTPDQKSNPSHMEAPFGGPSSNSNVSVQSPVDQKPNLSVNTGPNQGQPSSLGGPSQSSSYVATRPLTHFSDPSASGVAGNMGGVPGGPMPNRQSPVSMGPMGNQFMGRNTTSGLTPPPQVNQKSQQHFGSSAVPTKTSSGPNIQMSQTQQLQINPGNQQIQVSQTQQFQLNQDVKPQIHQQSQQTNAGHGSSQSQMEGGPGNMYAGYQAQHQHQSQVNAQFQLSMAQSQSVSFGPQFSGNNSSNNNQPASGATTMEQAASNRQRNQHRQQQQHHQMQQFLNARPPPEYKPQHQNMQHNGLMTTLNKQGGVRYPQNVRMPMVPPYQDPHSPHVRGPNPPQQGTTASQLRSPQGMGSDVLGPYNQAQMTLSGSSTGISPNHIAATSQASQIQGSKANNVTASVNKPIYTSALLRNRAPNVNVGPEGLNISQRPPAEWRQMLFQQQQQQQQAQQQHQIHMQQQQHMTVRMQGQQLTRFPSYRGMQPNQFNNNMGPMQTGPGGAVNPSGGIMVRGVHQQMQQQTQQQQHLHQQQAQHHMHHIHQSRGIGGRGQRPQMMVQQQQQQQQQQMMLHQTVVDSSGPTDGSGSNVSSGPVNSNMNIQMSAAQSQIFASMGQRGLNSNTSSDQTVNGSGNTNVNASGGSLGGDSGQFNLDFLDSIEPSTTDLLNFDQITGAHFSLLDEMGILGK